MIVWKLDSHAGVVLAQSCQYQMRMLGRLKCDLSLVFFIILLCIRCSPDLSVMLRTYNLDTNTLLSSSTAFVIVFENKTVASGCALSLPNKEPYSCALVKVQDLDSLFLYYSKVKFY